MINFFYFLFLFFIFYLTETNRLEFDSDFLRQVAEYHVAVQRPSGTFSLEENVPENVLHVSDQNGCVYDSSNRDGNGNDSSSSNNNSSSSSSSNKNHENDSGLTILNSESRYNDHGINISPSNCVDKINNNLLNLKLNSKLKINLIEHSEEEKNLEKENKSENELEIDKEREKEREKLIHLETLSRAEREVCVMCGGRRQVYCGDCGGQRMIRAGTLLPPRIKLPFDLLLVVHW